MNTPLPDPDFKLQADKLRRLRDSQPRVTLAEAQEQAREVMAATCKRPDPDDQFWRNERERQAMRKRYEAVVAGVCHTCGNHSEWTWNGQCRGCLERPRQKKDPDDFLLSLWRMKQQEHDEAVRLKWQKRGAWCFTGLAIAVGILFIMWGCRQLP